MLVIGKLFNLTIVVDNVGGGEDVEAEDNN
jgi:hypothetical protein